MTAGVEPKETTDREEVTLLRGEAQMRQPGNLPGTLQEAYPWRLILNAVRRAGAADPLPAPTSPESDANVSR